MIDKLDSQGGHIAVLLVIVLSAMLGCWLNIHSAERVVDLALGGLLVEMAAVRRVEC